jgi:hypothetical protein
MSNPIWFYILSLLAVRDEGEDTTIYHTSAIIAGTEQDDMHEIGLRQARKEYPPEQGFYRHNVTVGRIKPDKLYTLREGEMYAGIERKDLLN